jgi:DMSO reductase family type II enzyme heme b subunit
MKISRSGIILLAIVLGVAFVALVSYGLMYARGVPVTVPPVQRVRLVTPYLKDKAIDLNKGVVLADWADIPSVEVELIYQVMVLPWSKGLTPSITVKSFHTDNDIYFLVSWKDESENRHVSTAEFSDAVALMFAISDRVPPSTLMMGFLGKQGVNIWHWKASQDAEFWLKRPMATMAYADLNYPFEDQETLSVSKRTPVSAVDDLIAVRVTTTMVKATQNVQGRGVWNNGMWYVVLKRALNATNPQEDVAFGHGMSRLMALAVWEGARADRGGRKSISDWVQLEFR